MGGLRRPAVLLLGNSAPGVNSGLKDFALFMFQRNALSTPYWKPALFSGNLTHFSLPCLFWDFIWFILRQNNSASQVTKRKSKVETKK